MRRRLLDTEVGAWVPATVLDADLSHLAVRVYALLAMYAAQGLPQPPALPLAHRLHCTCPQLRAALGELRRWRAAPEWLRRRLPAAASPG